MDLADAYQFKQLRNQARAVSQVEERNQRRSRQTGAELDDLHARVERLTLLCESMWELVCETTGLTGEHLAHKLYQLDMADGTHDGRRQPMAGDCECGAKVNPRAKVCQFCGAPPPPRSAFDRV